MRWRNAAWQGLALLVHRGELRDLGPVALLEQGQVLLQLSETLLLHHKTTPQLTVLLVDFFTADLEGVVLLRAQLGFVLSLL